MLEYTPLLVAAIVFIFVAWVVYFFVRYVATQASLQRRLSGSLPVDSAQTSEIRAILFQSVTGAFDEKTFGIEGPIRTKLKRDLIRAAYFSDQAISVYIFVRLAVVLILPTIAFLLMWFFFAGAGFLLVIAIVSLCAFIAILGPDAYIARRQRLMQMEYRLVFPDLLDMLVVCVDAGLGLDAALSRIQPEVAKQSSALGINLQILGAETRAGRSTPDALGTFADRLNIDEARAFVILLKQSLELGTDITHALRVFSDEMRNKRLLRAEETANKLPVKMVIPLGGLIFPVILVMVLYPVIIRLLSVMQQTGRY